MKQPRMHKQGGEEAPPLTVCRARPEVATPSHERRWVIERAAAAEHEKEDREVERYERWGQENPGSPYAENLFEWFACPTVLDRPVLHPSRLGQHNLQESHP